MKFKGFILAGILTAFLSSYISTDNKLQEGSTAPTIERISGEKIEMKDGKEKLISFWSPKDAESRISNRKFSDLYKESDVEFITICIDSDESLAREVLKCDGIASQQQIAYSEVSERVFKDYGVSENPGAFLINGEGKIKRIM
ncbi:MAG: redoxin domain-containing protein [Muribaculaceae bacterium]|nr:redoxin domain-containing protein [Muribaculaceae bacterium]